MGKGEQQEASLEETFQEISSIIEKMQEREVTLEESFSLYEQGIRKLKLCPEQQFKNLLPDFSATHSSSLNNIK